MTNTNAARLFFNQEVPLLVIWALNINDPWRQGLFIYGSFRAGEKNVKHALEVAAAGWHNIIKLCD
jgi:hypothetical protein